MMVDRLEQLLDGSLDGTTLGVSQNNDQPCAEAGSGKFDTSYLRRSHDSAGHTDDKEIAESLVKDDLCRDAGVGAAKDYGKRALPLDQRQTPCVLLAGVSVSQAAHESAVSLSKTFECFLCGDHEGVIL